MSLCINPNCQNSDNPDNLPRCQSCDSELLLEGRYRVTHLLSDKGGFGKTFEVIDRNGIPDDEWDWREEDPDISDLLADFIDHLMARSVNRRPADTKFYSLKVLSIVR